MKTEQSPKKRGDLKVLITAQEAFPVLETAFLDAQKQIVLGFRIFDPCTKLQSERAQAIGATWADLIKHTLCRGVDVTIFIGDFDPINATDLHRGTTASLQHLSVLAKGLEAGAGKLTYQALLHPAKIGLAARVLFAPIARRKLRDILQKAAQSDEDILATAPRLRPWVQLKDGTAVMRPSAIPHQHPASHHHKLAVFDGTRLYIGGLDLNNRRYDSPKHERATQHTWHDVQLMLTDTDLARAGLDYLLRLNDTVAGATPWPATEGFVRSLSQRRRFAGAFISPRANLREIRATHIEHIKRAEQLIYLETQFLRDRSITRALCHAAKRNPDLRLIVILPGAPEDVAFHGSGTLEARFGEYLQARCITRLRRAFGARMLVGSPVQSRSMSDADVDTKRAQLSDAPLIYVHAKVSIFDDTAAIVSSANLNGRSLNWDSEAGIVLHHPEDVAQVTRRVLGHWLPEDAQDRFFMPQTAQQAWTDWVAKNENCAPQDHRGFIVPYAVTPARKFGRRIFGVPEPMV